MANRMRETRYADSESRISANCRRSRVVVVEFPGGDHSSLVAAAIDVDHSGRTEVCQGTLLTRDQVTFTGLPAAFASRAASTSGLRRVFAAITRSCIGTITRTRSSGTCNALPARCGPRTGVEFPSRPSAFRRVHSATAARGYEGCMCDVSHRVGSLELLMRGRQTVWNRSSHEVGNAPRNRALLFRLAAF
jgi:hypothetical protein